MQTSVLRAILDPELWREYRPLLAADLFTDELGQIFALLDHVEGRQDARLTRADLGALFAAHHPTATQAAREAFEAAVDDLFEAPPLQSHVLRDCIASLYAQRWGHRIAELALRYAEGDREAIQAIRNEVAQAGSLLTPGGVREPLAWTRELVEGVADYSGRWKFNIRTLHEIVPGIAPGEFTIVFATPETGKSTFCTSIVASPKGFLHQGAKVLYLANEEKVENLSERLIGCRVGIPKEDVRLNAELALGIIAPFKDQLFVIDAVGMDLNDIEKHVDYFQPDIVIVDQADKVVVPGRFNRSDEKLRALYTALREIAKRKNVALLGVSQAGNEAAGKTRLLPNMMEGSKVGKFAEADLILGIGKHNSENGDDSPVRFITVGKNKISGQHGTVTVQLDKALFRYTE